MSLPFTFTPPTGINDTTQFPDDDPQIRVHLQALLDQLKDYINNNLQFTSVLNMNGFIKLSNGLIIQWGRTVSIMMNEETKTIALNTAFPSVNILVVPFIIEVNGYVPTRVRIGADWFAQNQFRQTITDTVGNTSLTITTGYLSIGY